MTAFGIVLLVFGAIGLLAVWALFWIYVTDSDPGKQPRLKRAMVCWWYHRWHRDRNGSWGRHFCSSCEHVQYGRHHVPDGCDR